MSDKRVRRGSVVQITEAHGRAGWVGAFLMVKEVKRFGVMGFVAHIATHDEQQRAYVRLPWDHVEYIGEAPLVPQDL